ncbi:ABC transporter ATP-binding protein [Bacillus sp. T33-2]|uniref:ABC transporter ATP-binding protein n=1 Tax=Bacillus sp. T33-2 TaxID=2054168 RepID=UPI000C790CEE|nr:ABC transporter ATP-binding protein [Bacillus sp. T33-2]PLR98848.1 ABC transporter ATP-binding protein [Bacillus sp. T33-2]
MPLVTVQGLEKSFQQTKIIKGITFQLEKGRGIALIGPNGAGKTTTLRMLSGLFAPTSGKIVFDGSREGEDIRKFIGYLPPHPVFHDWMTGREFLEHVGKLAGLSGGQSKSRTAALLELVGIGEAQNRRIGKYSGGMKQRLGIAQAIIHRPKLVTLDEPVSALDPLGRREVLDLIDLLKKEATVLFSTHFLNDAEEVCDDILFLHNGMIVEKGTMDQLREKYKHSKIDLVFHKNASFYIDDLPCQDAIENVVAEGNSASIFAKDVELVKHVILQEAARKNWPLIRFQLSTMNLEDVFMKVVQK